MTAVITWGDVDMPLQRIDDAIYVFEHVRAGENGCWDWLGYVDPNGYGVWPGRRHGRRCYAHRISYEAFVGPIGPELTIDHLCRNRKCCRPEHLEPVPLRVNILRGTNPAAVNARKTHCINGHPFNEENTYTSTGHRVCKVCVAARRKTKPGTAIRSASLRADLPTTSSAMGGAGGREGVS